MNPGDTFFRLGIGPHERHTYFVLTHPDRNGRAVVVNMTSDNADLSCTLVVGDHPRITHNTYMRYEDASEAEVAGLAMLMGVGKILAEPPVLTPVLNRIRAGALVSAKTKGVIQDRIRECMRVCP